jgi:hypothetical protein
MEGSWEYEGVSQSFRTESITKSTTNTCSEATLRVTAAKLTRLTHKIAIQLYLVVQSCTTCSSRYRRPVRKLLDTPCILNKQLRAEDKGRSSSLEVTCRANNSSFEEKKIDTKCYTGRILWDLGNRKHIQDLERKLEPKRPPGRPRRRWGILEWMLRKCGGELWNRCIRLRIGTSGGCCEHGNEPSGSIKCGEFLD